MTKEEIEKRIDNAIERDNLNFLNQLAPQKDQTIDCPICLASSQVESNNIHLYILMKENEMLRRLVDKWEKSYNDIIASQKELIGMFDETIKNAEGASNK